jgi:hypothetical protein
MRKKQRRPASKHTSAGHEGQTLLIRHFVVDKMARRDERLFLENIVVQVSTFSQAHRRQTD